MQAIITFPLQLLKKDRESMNFGGYTPASNYYAIVRQ